MHIEILQKLYMRKFKINYYKRFLHLINYDIMENNKLKEV